MILTLIFGWWIIFTMPIEVYLFHAYFILKLCFVGGLILYHFECHVMYKQLQKNYVKYSSFKLRLWNEVATVFLVAIVFLIVLKDSSGFVWGMLGLVIFSVTLVLAIKIYKKSRDKNEIAKKSEEKEKPKLTPTPLSKE